MTPTALSFIILFYDKQSVKIRSGAGNFASERVPKKLIDFFDGNTLYFFEKKEISHRPNDSIRSENALARNGI
jgi:hypothetical protein